MKALGMNEMLAVGGDDYRDVAVKVARSRGIQHALKARSLQSRRSAIENRKKSASVAASNIRSAVGAPSSPWETSQVVHGMQQAYMAAWELFSAGEPPRHIRVGGANPG